MAALFAFEIEEALRYLNDPDFYLPTEEVDLEAGKIWLGAADDTVIRKRGVEFVDGSAPGFAAIVGCGPHTGNRQGYRRRVPAPQPLHLLRRQPQRHYVCRSSSSKPVSRWAGTPVSCPSARISLRPFSPSGLPTGPPWLSVAFSRAITRKS
jgi:hypothetical protein